MILWETCYIDVDIDTLNRDVDTDYSQRFVLTVQGSSLYVVSSNLLLLRILYYKPHVASTHIGVGISSSLIDNNIYAFPNLSLQIF